MKVPKEFIGCSALYLLWRASIANTHNKNDAKRQIKDGRWGLVKEAAIITGSVTALATLAARPTNTRVFATRVTILFTTLAGVCLYQTFTQEERDQNDIEPTKLKQAARMCGALFAAYLGVQKTYPITAIFGAYLTTHEICKLPQAHIFRDSVLNWIRPEEVMRITHVFAAFGALAFLLPLQAKPS